MFSKNILTFLKCREITSNLCHWKYLNVSCNLHEYIQSFFFFFTLIPVDINHDTYTLSLLGMNFVQEK